MTKDRTVLVLDLKWCLRCVLWRKIKKCHPQTGTYPTAEVPAADAPGPAGSAPPPHWPHPGDVVTGGEAG